MKKCLKSNRNCIMTARNDHCASSVCSGIQNSVIIDQLPSINNPKMLVCNIDYQNKKLFQEREQIVLRFTVTLCRPHLRKSSVTFTVIVVKMSRVLIDLWQLWQMGKQARRLLLFIGLFAEPPPIHRRTHKSFTLFLEQTWQ